MGKKLIRLHTEDDNSIFDCLFDQGIEIQPQSEIAFHSISMTQANKFLVVDNTNDTIQFQVQVARKSTFDGVAANQTIKVNVPHGTYTKHNSTQLLETLSVRMNQELLIENSKEHGTSISIHLNSASKVSIDVAYGRRLQISSNVDDVPNYESYGVTALSRAAGNNFKREIGSSNDFSSYAFGLVPFTKGCGNITVGVSKLTAGATTNNSGVIGLTQNLEAMRNGTPITLADLDYFYEIPVHGGAIAQGDRIGMNLSNGKIQTIQYRGGGRVILKEEDYDYTNFGSRKYYPVIIMNSNQDHFRLNQIKWSPEPHETPPSTKFEISTEGIIGAVPRPAGLVPTVYNFIFPTVEMGEFFGYDFQNQNALSVTDIEKIFTAQRGFSNVISGDNYIIELLNMKIDSYDSFNRNGSGGGRRNILASIPVNERILDAQSNLLQYEPNELSFISMNNEYLLRLRNIKARIVNQEFGTVFNAGTISVNILIRDDPK